MEKYSQYRDKGSGIAPFLPVPSPPSTILTTPLHIFLFTLRLPLLLTAITASLLLFPVLPSQSLPRKALLWLILAVPGIWWVDLRIDGIRRGTLSRASSSGRLPGPGSVIAASCTSPLDALYLAAIFDPVCVRCWSSGRAVQRISLLYAVALPLLPACLQAAAPDPSSTTTATLATLARDHPHRPLLLFPESTPTNGRGVLPLSPSLLSSAPSPRASPAPLFPTSLRYSPADVTTPVPGRRAALKFLWDLCKAPTHTIRVRIAEPVFNDAYTAAGNGDAAARRTGYEANFFDQMDRRSSAARRGVDGAAVKGTGREAGESDEAEGELTDEEQRVLDRVGEALARLGRVRRVGLGVREKGEFVGLWRRRGR